MFRCNDEEHSLIFPLANKTSRVVLINPSLIPLIILIYGSGSTSTI